MIAFSLIDEFNNSKNDPNYVRWLFTYTANEDGESVKEQAHFMHQCTDEDFSKFYPPDTNAEKIIKKLKDQNALYCID